MNSAMTLKVNKVSFIQWVIMWVSEDVGGGDMALLRFSCEIHSDSIVLCFV